MGEAPLAARFREHFQALLSSFGSSPARLVVALSGGLDSAVLLHLLRFQLPEPRPHLTAAHFDHRMRAGSESDAAWVAGLCRAWCVPFDSGAAGTRLRSEDEARTARYAYLHEVLGRKKGELLLTAHHADDQAETVLFRILRGTGIAGLRGIPDRTPEGVMRPLLPYWRQELAEYAEKSGIRWRTDPTNESLGPARNRIRHVLLPEIEQSVAPGARRSLVRLAELARESEEAWELAVQEIEDRIVAVEDGVVLVARAELRQYHPTIGTRILRKALRRFGTVPGRIGTRSALQFITDAPSGRKLRLPGGVLISTEFAYARIERETEPVEDRPVLIGPLEGEREQSHLLRLGGRSYRVEVRLVEAGSAGSDTRLARWEVGFPYERLRLPLRLRARQAGDRLLTPVGRRSLKKLMIERRVPAGERNARPVLEDSAGEILWVGGLGPAPTERVVAGEKQLHIAILDEPGG
jgi:tRNA(Ile)-lysidine synthase